MSPRIAIVSDIHGNLSALEAVIADLRAQAPDLVVNAGDLVGNGASNAEVVERVAELGWPGIYGNTDEMLWNPERLAQLSSRLPHLSAMLTAISDVRDFTREQLGASHLRYLQALPDSWSHSGIGVVHASPGDAWTSPTQRSSDAELAAPYADVAAPLVVFGHVHVPFVREVDGRTIANAGAVSLSYDGDTRASYLLVENAAPSIRRVTYDVEKECRALAGRRHPHHEWIGATLRAGRFVPFT